jgi:hypothetical protein
MVYLVSKRLWVENPVTSVAAVAVGCGVKMATVVAYFGLVAPRNVAWLGLLRALFFEALFALIVSPLVFSALDTNLRRPRRKRAHALE